MFTLTQQHFNCSLETAQGGGVYFEVCVRAGWEAEERIWRERRGFLQITRCDSSPLCVCWFTKPQTEAVTPRHASTHAHTQCNSQRLFLSPPVSQSISVSTIRRRADSSSLERKRSWNVTIMWCKEMDSTGGKPPFPFSFFYFFMGQGLEVIWSHRGRRNRGYKLIYSNLGLCFCSEQSPPSSQAFFMLNANGSVLFSRFPGIWSRQHKYVREKGLRMHPWCGQDAKP